LLNVFTAVRKLLTIQRIFPQVYVTTTIGGLTLWGRNDDSWV